MHLLTMKELMAFLKVKRNTVYQLRRLGLPAIHLGRSIRFDRDEVITWIRSNRSEATKPTAVPAGALCLAAAADEAAAVAEGADFLL